MSYELRGVVGAGSVLRTMTDDLFDSVTGGGPARALGFWWLPGGFDVRLAEWSARGPIAYVEAEYFGGVGEQQAAVFSAVGLGRHRYPARWLG
ncbi:hypothetical protein [Streptomyces sp. NPDC002671]